MKNKLKTLITKRITDIILVILVISIFLLTGKKNKPANDKVNNIQLESNNEIIEKTNPIQKTTSDIQNKESNSQNSLVENNSTPQAPIPVTKMFPKEGAPIAPAENKLAESFKALKPKEANQDDIVDRNAYFKSLSEQMNKLQGTASTDSEVTNNSSNQNAAEEYGDEEDGDLDEIPVQVQDEVEDIPQNPYRELNDRFPEPNIAE